MKDTAIYYGLKVKFSPVSMEYTYLYAAKQSAIKVGDIIEVPVRGSRALKRVTVTAIRIPRHKLSNNHEYTILRNTDKPAKKIGGLNNEAVTKTERAKAVADQQFIDQARLLATRCGLSVTDNMMMWINSVGDRSTRAGAIHVIENATSTTITSEERVAFYKGLVDMANKQEAKDRYEDSLNARMFG